MRDLGRLRWGLVPGSWAEKKGRPLINARAESIETQPAFEESFRCGGVSSPPMASTSGARRAWQAADLVHLPDDELFAFAGIWASYERNGGERRASCAIVTSQPNELMRPIHDRMPVILLVDSGGGLA